MTLHPAPIMHRDPRLQRIVDAQPHPLLFATISGAHLYGFPSPDSDVDLRGVHVLPLSIITGLEVRDETVSDERVAEGLEMDIVSHDVRKFMRLMLKKNGYVLEQLFSPLVVRTTSEHAELMEIAPGVVTRHHAHHYFGFADNQWRMFDRERPRRVKPLLYTYRVLLTGIHLMRTGRVEANLAVLNEDFRIPLVAGLIQQKLTGPEQGEVADTGVREHLQEMERLKSMLQAAMESSRLPDVPGDETRAALNDLLVRIRTRGLTGRDPRAREEKMG